MGVHELTPWAEAKVHDRIRKSYGLNVHGININEYQVVDRHISYVVNLNNCLCTCKKWQLSGLPCCHVIAVSRFLKIKDVGVWAKVWFKKSTYKATYQESVYPVGDVQSWNTQCNVTRVLPPNTEIRGAGRPKNKDRIPSKGEIPRAAYCKRCNSVGHTSNSCKQPAHSQRTTYDWGEHS